MPHFAGSVGHLFGTFNIGRLLSRTEHAQSLVRPKDHQPPVPTKRVGPGIGRTPTEKHPGGS